MDWRKSSFSGAQGATCLEAATGEGVILVRDTTDRGGVTLPVATAAWASFLSGLK